MKRTKFLTILIIVLFFSVSVFAQKADLRVSIYAPASAYAGQQLEKSVKVTIMNYGKSAARNFSLDLVLSKDSSIPIKFAKYSSHYSDDVLLRGGREFIRYLAPGKSINVVLNGTNTIPADTPSGYYFIGAVVDPGNKVSETSESNNVAVRRIKIGNSHSSASKLPDLGMYGFLKIGKRKRMVKWGKTIVLTPADATRFSRGYPVFEIYYSYREYNNVSSGTFKNKIFFNGKLVSQQTHLRLNAFQIKDVHTQAYLEPKNGKLEIHIDADDDVAESREDNNFHFSVNIIFKDFPEKETDRNLPDLIVKNIKLTNNCKIAVTVANIGKTGVPSYHYNLPKAVGIQMYVDGKPWGGLILKGFDPNGYLKKPYSQATYIWFPHAANLNLTAGTHTIKVIADNNKNLTEVKESNNTLTKKVYCSSNNPNSSTSSTPKSFILHFKDAYLVYEPSSKTLQIAAQRNVLSYGSDWQVVKLKSYLYHLREKFWKGFYWKVNTSRKEVYLIKGGSFGHFGGKETKLNIGVDVTGNSISPTRFFLRFHDTHLVYITSSKTLQIIEGDKILSYGTDWQKCKLKSYLFDLKQKFWKGFFWRINTSRGKVYRVKNGSLCEIGGNYTTLNIGVRISK